MATGAGGENPALLDVAGKVEHEVLPVAAGGVVAGGVFRHREVSDHGVAAARKVELDEHSARRERSARTESRIHGGVLVGEHLGLVSSRKVLRGSAHDGAAEARQRVEGRPMLERLGPDGGSDLGVRTGGVR